MEHKNLDAMIEIMDQELKNKGISRRDAMKLAAVGSAAFMLNPAETKAATKAYAGAKAKIVIVGGGLAGVATSAKILNELGDADITIVEPNEISVSYQPGQTLVAAGVYKKSDIMYNTADFMPGAVKWIKDIAVDFNPDQNKVKTEKNGELSYDFLIVAAGIMLNFKAIDGLVGECTSLGKNDEVSKIIGKNGIHSIYYADGAEQCWKGIQELAAAAKGGKKVNALFTDPNTPIKCGGAPKKIMYLVDARLREAGARDNATLTFNPDGAKLFGVPEYHEAIKKQFETRGFKWNYKHNLVAIDPVKKIATFNHHWEEKGAWDPDLEEYSIVKKAERVEAPYDFIHVTPPQKAPDLIGKSAVGSDKGWIPVEKETLQHVKYKNVFAIGDIAAVPMAKTGGSARKQYKVLVDNLISAMNGKPLQSKYDGYTVCPLITSIGTVMLAEFNWTAKPTPSFPLDPTQERWIWWLMKVYALKPMTIYGMLSGRA